MKYYYTDPLAAAWLAKHHGMRFCESWGDVWADRDCIIEPKSETHGMAGSDMLHKYLSISYYGGILSASYANGRNGELINHRVDPHWKSDHLPDRLYIHPDSLHLLEPQEGDLWAGRGEDAHPCVWYITDTECAEKLKTNGELRQRMICYHRNGIPFMWPESENA